MRQPLFSADKKASESGFSGGSVRSGQPRKVPAARQAAPAIRQTAEPFPHAFSQFSGPDRVSLVRMPQTLPKGTDITVLGKYTYTGNWWYVETKLNDRLTRGFIDRDWAALKIDGKVYTGNEELGFPALSPRNTAKTGMITVNGNSDDAMIVRRRSDPESSMVARIYGVWGWISSGHSQYTANDEITDLD